MIGKSRQWGFIVIDLKAKQAETPPGKSDKNCPHEIEEGTGMRAPLSAYDERCED